MVVVRSGSDHPGHKVNGWMNWADFLHAHMVSGKLKVTSGMHMVKYVCDLLGPGTLKSALSQE